MSEHLLLSWTVSANSTFTSGGSLSKPDWVTIEEKLDQSLTRGGTVTLDAEDKNGCSRSLQVRAENGRFVVTFGMEVEGDWIVRTYKNSTSESEDVVILGDVWNSRMVCAEVPLLVAIFREFFNSRDVSKALLSC